MSNPVNKAWWIGYTDPDLDEDRINTEIVYGEDILSVALRLSKDLRLKEFNVVSIERDKCYDL